jgi:hypothetical protein
VRRRLRWALLCAFGAFAVILAMWATRDPGAPPQIIVPQAETTVVAALPRVQLPTIPHVAATTEISTLPTTSAKPKPRTTTKPPPPPPKPTQTTTAATTTQPTTPWWWDWYFGRTSCRRCR